MIESMVLVRRYLGGVFRGFKNGSRQHLEQLWSTQHTRKDGWAEQYQNSWDAPHRDVLIDNVESIGAVSSVLDLGCNGGANLIALSHCMSPIPIMTGIDINKTAVDTANSFFRKSGWGHAEAHQGTMPEALEVIEDKSYDVVIATAVLQHISPDSFNATLSHALRIAAKGCVFIDMHRFKSFLGGESKSPTKIHGERFDRDWWELKQDGWNMAVSELPPAASLANVGDINAVIVFKRII